MIETLPMFDVFDLLPEPPLSEILQYMQPDDTRPKSERLKSARIDAKAVAEAKRRGWVVEWNYDWGIGSHVREYGPEVYDKEPDTCEIAFLRDADENILDSIGCVDDASDEDRRFVEVELMVAAVSDLAPEPARAAA